MSVLLKIWIALQAAAIAFAAVVYELERKKKKREQGLCRRCKNLSKSYDGGMLSKDLYYCPHINLGRYGFEDAPSVCSQFEEKETK